MYLVVNQTKKSVILNDLKVEIPAESMVDLDKHKKNKTMRTEDSQDLMHARQTGLLRTMKKDKPKKEEPAPPPPPAQPDMSSVLGELKDLIREEIRASKPESQAPAPSMDINQMMTMMQDIKNLVASGRVAASDINMDEVNLESGIDEQKLLEIHSAAMRKMQNNSNVKSEISYETNTVKDSGFSDNITDLEDLL